MRAGSASAASCSPSKRASASRRSPSAVSIGPAIALPRCNESQAPCSMRPSSALRALESTSAYETLPASRARTLLAPAGSSAACSATTAPSRRSAQSVRDGHREHNDN
jgi:hypothetical protein